MKQEKKETTTWRFNFILKLSRFIPITSKLYLIVALLMTSKVNINLRLPTIQLPYQLTLRMHSHIITKEFPWIEWDFSMKQLSVLHRPFSFKIIKQTFITIGDLHTGKQRIMIKLLKTTVKRYIQMEGTLKLTTTGHSVMTNRVNFIKPKMITSNHVNCSQIMFLLFITQALLGKKQEVIDFLLL